MVPFVVGAWGYDANEVNRADNTGAAYIFKREDTNWTEVAKLMASDGTAIDLVGCSVSISGAWHVTERTEKAKEN